MSQDAGTWDRRDMDGRLQRVEVDLAVMKADHMQIKTDMREVRTMLDKSADLQAAILRAVTATLITTLVGALGFILWQVYTHPHGFGP
jgi:hypothetical protein